MLASLLLVLSRFGGRLLLRLDILLSIHNMPLQSALEHCWHVILQVQMPLRGEEGSPFPSASFRDLKMFRSATQKAKTLGKTLEFGYVHIVFVLDT